MSAASASTSERVDAGLPIDACLGRLETAIAAARELGVGVQEAEAVHGDAVARLGFPADAYVVALVGGTGVGKSSLVNAARRRRRSARASVRRPTTAAPVAWVPAGSAAELEPLLDWLGVAAAESTPRRRRRCRARCRGPRLPGWRSSICPISTRSPSTTAPGSTPSCRASTP